VRNQVPSGEIDVFGVAERKEWAILRFPKKERALSRLRAVVVLGATFLAACEGCHERRRICLASSSGVEAPTPEAPAGGVTFAVRTSDLKDERPPPKAFASAMCFSGR